MKPTSSLAKAAAIGAFGVVSIGGLAIAGALPGISSATPPVTTPAPNGNAGQHPDLGATNGADSSNGHAHSSEVAATQPTTATTSPRTDGLANALTHVTNPTAAAVLGTVAASTPGPGFGTAVSGTASADHPTPPVSTPPVSVPPVTTPSQSDPGLAHRP